ncbi:MAG: tetratricopeptide repeat protein [Treponema sp.]|jgi:tetratricopeptide (TPR) repeat protein|nr:tetratricopeptide repeat protein [Treponema sp.]
MNSTRIVCLLILSALSFPVAAQENAWSPNPEVDELMRAGIEYHDEGDYDKAIEYYEKALKLAPDTPGIYYELAFSYLYKGNPEEALKHSQKGIDLARNDESQLPGLYDLKGSALDDLGRHEEAVEVYLDALNRFDMNSTRLYYNLGLTYYRMGERDKARDSLAQSLINDPFHPSSNFLLGKICYEQGRKSQSLYCLCYFLLLEPYTERAGEAYSTIEQLMSGAEDGITVSDSGNFTAFDIMISLLFDEKESSGVDPKSSGETDGEPSPDERFMEKLDAFFTAGQAPLVQSLRRTENHHPADDLWWEFYVPFFFRITESDHFETFCRYIGMSVSPESTVWLDENEEKVETMFEWLNTAPEERDE